MIKRNNKMASRSQTKFVRKSSEPENINSTDSQIEKSELKLDVLNKYIQNKNPDNHFNQKSNVLEKNLTKSNHNSLGIISTDKQGDAS